MQNRASHPQYCETARQDLGFRVQFLAFVLLNSFGSGVINMQTHEIDYMIVRILEHHGPCTLDRLVDTISDCSWNQIFAAVDTMSRDGRLRLQHPRRFGIQISLRRQASRSFSQAV